jgi:S-methylmethionine-dependent homocysteine/selenocysteine methylase
MRNADGVANGRSSQPPLDLMVRHNRGGHQVCCSWIFCLILLLGATLHDGSEYRGDYGATMSQEALIAFHRPRVELLLANRALAPDLFACEVASSLAKTAPIR